MISEKNTKSINNRSQTYISVNSYCYRESDLLGCGYQSRVYKAFHASKKYQVALKIIDITKINDGIHKELLEAELASLQALKGTQHVVNLIEVVKTEECIYVITELCKGDLSTESNPKLNQREAWNYIKQIIKGYKELYERGIIHRDIKPQNMFKKDSVRIKLGDFGFATTLQQAKRQCYYNIGSPSYMAPQVLKRNAYSHSSDIWAIGVSYFQLATGKMPWDGKDQQQISNQISQDNIKRQIKQCKLSQESKCFLSKLLVYQSFGRISPEELFSYQLFQSLPRKTLPKLTSFDKISTSTAETPKIQSSRSFDLKNCENKNQQQLFEIFQPQVNKVVKPSLERHNRRMSFEGNYLSSQNLCSSLKVPQRVVASSKQVNQVNISNNIAFKKKYRASFDVNHQHQIIKDVNKFAESSIQKLLEGHIQLINLVLKLLRQMQQAQIKQNLSSEFHVFKICLRNYVIKTIQKLTNLENCQNSGILESIANKDEIKSYLSSSSFKKITLIIKSLRQKVEQQKQLAQHWIRAKQQKPRAVSNAGISIIKLVRNCQNPSQYKQIFEILGLVCNVIQIFSYLSKNAYFTSEIILGTIKLSNNSISWQDLLAKMLDVQKHK